MRTHEVNARSIGRLGRQALLALVTAGAALYCGTAAAAPAQPGLRSFPLDTTGATFDAEVIGDEHFDYLKTTDGIVVVFDPATGLYDVAVIGQDANGLSALLPSGTHVSDLTTYGGRVSPGSVPVIDDEILAELAELAENNNTPPGTLPLAAGPVITTTTTRPMLTILLEFTQARPGSVIPPGMFQGTLTTDVAHWSDQLYSFSFGSVNHYYNDMSLGKFSFVRAAETQGSSPSGMVRVRLPFAHPNAKKDHALLQLYLKEALAVADPFVDFASFDTNSDGKVGRDELDVIFVVAGYESSNTSKEPSIWAHVLDFADKPTLDGKILTSYAAVGELQRHNIGGTVTEVPATVGVLVHELGHLAVGLPDLYKGPTPIGGFCVMGGGSWGAQDGEPAGTTPTAMSAWSRVHTGFVTPIVIEPGAPSQVVGLAQTAGAQIFKLEIPPTIYKINTSNPDRYFLIDNRQNAGFDRGLQRSLDFDPISGGLGIYRIDEARKAGAGKIAMMANDSAAPAGISALYNLEGGKTFTPVSDPSSDDGSGMYTGLSVTNVSAAGPIMVATVGFQPFDCNAITAKIKEHEVHGRAFKLILNNNVFLGYRSTGSQSNLGVDSNATVTLHVEAPGMWSTGPCP